VLTSEGAVYGYLEARGFEAGRIGDCVQMYSLQPLVRLDRETVVCINSPEGLACFLFCTVRLVARILPWSCIDGYCQVYVEQRWILGCYCVCIEAVPCISYLNLCLSDLCKTCYMMSTLCCKRHCLCICLKLKW
jgi:hypothetical protein